MSLPVLQIVISVFASAIALWVGITRRRRLPIGIFIILLLAQIVLAIVIDNRQSSEQRQRDSQLSKIDDLKQQLATFIQVVPQLSQAGTDSILIRLANLENKLVHERKPEAHAIASLSLAKQLLEFADQRDKGTPGPFGTQMFGQAMFGGPSPDQLVKYNQETVRQYGDRFRSEVLAALRQTARKLDAGFETLASNPGGTPGIRRIAEVLVTITSPN
jgi:hypothetical protein